MTIQFIGTIDPMALPQGPQGIPGVPGSVGPAGPAGPAAVIDMTALAAAVAAILAGTPVVVTPPAGGGGTAPPAGTGPDGSFVFYFDGATKSPGDYDYSGTTTVYNAKPRVVDPLFPNQTQVTESTFPAGQNGGFQPRMPNDFLDVSGFTYQWLRILPTDDTDLFFMGGEGPGDTPFYKSGGSQNVTQYATAPIKANVWNWLRIPFKTINGGQVSPTTALYKYTFSIAGAPGTTKIQVGYQGYSKV